MWYGKCVQLVEFTNGLIQDMPRKLRDAFDEMNHDNTPTTIFDFIMSCRIMIKDFRVELELLKKARSNDMSNWPCTYIINV